MFIQLILFPILFFPLEIFGNPLDTACQIQHSESQQHYVNSQCMSFIRDPCEDGTQCYNNLEETSFGVECIEKKCKVLTGYKCSHDVDCASESDKCINQKCTLVTCECKSYEDCVNYKCASKICSTTPDCLVDGGSDSFCFENYCHPLASFGGKCGITSDCAEPNASCINSICTIQNDEKDNGGEKTPNDISNNEVNFECSNDNNKSSFGIGFAVGFLVASVSGFALYAAFTTNLFQKMLYKVGHGPVVEGQLIYEKEIQLSNID